MNKFNTSTILFKNLSQALSKRTFSTNIPKDVENRVYELRTYSISLENFANFISLTQEHMHMRAKHSKLCGYWMSELGGINEVVHLWEYSSLDHRAQVRSNLRFDKDWNEKYMAKMKPMVLKQENIVLKEFPWGKLSLPENLDSKKVWELRTYQIKAGQVPKWEDLISNGIEARKQYSSPSGLFYSEIGKLNTVVSLWSYDNFEDRTKARRAALADPKWSGAVQSSYEITEKQENKTLIPVIFPTK
ncbi:hypothetical protein PPL_04913 [Heterostelium album PN500]|uniref:NIPSNAP domain-containing protein n=1 Tax=Heterostelium pallidum (strain ATCC 26659 / Pp 5 / PN500) TaxID=670386 RepID=D3B8X0_HETP5|nr:hypothetical protein PPL_04913 [Heterostelium album PN500]EFA82488.1 hypothetical protein PPL_04913 [Heterostelium album PN500]|eukprot:XP_020434605.1 hypothetical protein PPL_04913 [Heterostelium album PN500]